MTTPDARPSRTPARPAEPLPNEVEGVARQLTERHFPEMARALRVAARPLLLRWRARSPFATPELDRLAILEFEGSVSGLLEALAGAMEFGDADRIRHVIAESPTHGLARSVRSFSAQTLLAEERILRSVMVIELERELRRAATTEEKAALHELLDLVGEHSVLALVRADGNEHERVTQGRMAGMHRLATLGTLVAGVAHDAANLMLPMHMSLEHLQQAEMSPEAREGVTTIALILKQFQNSIVNLRWLSIDSQQGAQGDGSDDSGAGARPGRGRLRPDAALNLSAWGAEVAEFHRRVLPPGIELRFDLPAGLPPVRVSSAALSQAVFNLIRNAQQAIVSGWAAKERIEPGHERRGHIVVRAARRAESGAAAVDLTIEDDGPGMTPEILRRGAEPYFTTKNGGSGLGLTMVRALVLGCGGSIALHSPPPGAKRGTAVVLTLMLAAKP